MPQRLGRYAVRRRIGAGGFATVWLAYDEQLDSPVAVKVLAENWTEDAQVTRRFLEEGRYLRRVESPHVVTVYDAGELDDGRPYLVMSYADQGTLADRLAVAGMTAEQAMEVIRQVGAGLQALHDLDILHRDIKPANVLFRTQHGQVRAMVGDLGLGKALDVSSRLTMIAGTPSYVAPEQASAESPDARADQYSLACLAYLLLSGRAPYEHASLQQAAHPEAPAPLSTPQRPFPESADAVIRRALSVDREDRYASVAEFVDALERAVGPLDAAAQTTPWIAPDPDLTQPGRRPTPVPGADLPELPTTVRRRGRTVFAAVAAALALAAGAVGGYAWQTSARASQVEITDAQGAISVTVPRSWDAAVATEGWAGPQATSTDSGRDYAALSAGTTTGWASNEDGGQGVFAGLMPGEKVPDLMPGHPECAVKEPPVIEDDASGDIDAKTVVHTGCPGGVTVERVVQVSSNQLLWIQVRSAQIGTARSVLESVQTHLF